MAARVLVAANAAEVAKIVVVEEVAQLQKRTVAVAEEEQVGDVVVEERTAAAYHCVDQEEAHGLLIAWTSSVLGQGEADPETHEGAVRWVADQRVVVAAVALLGLFLFLVLRHPKVGSLWAPVLFQVVLLVLEVLVLQVLVGLVPSSWADQAGHGHHLCPPSWVDLVLEMKGCCRGSAAAGVVVVEEEAPTIDVASCCDYSCVGFRRSSCEADVLQHHVAMEAALFL